MKYVNVYDTNRVSRKFNSVDEATQAIPDKYKGAASTLTVAELEQYLVPGQQVIIENQGMSEFTPGQGYFAE